MTWVDWTSSAGSLIALTICIFYLPYLHYQVRLKPPTISTKVLVSKLYFLKFLLSLEVNGIQMDVAQRSDQFRVKAQEALEELEVGKNF